MQPKESPLWRKQSGSSACVSKTPQRFAPHSKRALAYDGPALVDVVTDANVLAMPPRATIHQAAGFALAMTEIAFAGHSDDVLDTVAANWREFR